MEWNVENLYDTLHDVGFDDREFLPNAERRWNTPRYFHKQSSLAKTILAAGGLQPVDLVALCEVENDSVMHFLCRRTRLARLGYEYLVTHSADRRGIDVALLYQPETFALLHSEPTVYRTTVCENAPRATYFMPPAPSLRRHTRRIRGPLPLSPRRRHHLRTLPFARRRNLAPSGRQHRPLPTYSAPTGHGRFQ